MTESNSSTNRDPVDENEAMPLSSHSPAPLDPGSSAPHPPALSPESLEIGSAEPLLEDEELPRYSGYAAKLNSPRRRKGKAKGRRRRLFPRRRRRKQRMRVLVAMLIASAVGWVVFAAGRTHVEPLPVLTLGDLPSTEVVVSVTAHPPSLFVQVDGNSWRRLSTREREVLVEETGTTAQSAGYTGALFRTTAGASVAQWMKSNGVLLFEPGESDS